MTVGHYALPQVLDYIKNSGLNYWWILAIKHDGVSKPLRHQQVYVMWRPLLWFVKGSRLRTSGSIKDLIESQPSDKGVYRWDTNKIERTLLLLVFYCFIFMEFVLASYPKSDSFES